MRKVPWPGSKAESPEEFAGGVATAVKEPALVHRVDPVYPVLAVSAGLEGTLILEAIVDRDGRVESLRVLRSQGVLDRAALDAVKQWRYSPVLLNGQPEKFILTVVVSFKLEDT
jgi:protein TonB